MFFRCPATRWPTGGRPHQHLPSLREIVYEKPPMSIGILLARSFERIAFVSDHPKAGLCLASTEALRATQSQRFDELARGDACCLHEVPTNSTADVASFFQGVSDNDPASPATRKIPSRSYHQNLLSPCSHRGRQSRVVP